MKYFLKHLLFCTVIMLFNFSLYAQLSQRVITVTRSTMDIPGLAKMIAAQTGMEYSLNMQNTSLKKNVQLRLGKYKLEDIMKAVQEQAGLNYKIIGDHILFTDYKPVKKDSGVVAKPLVKSSGQNIVQKATQKTVQQSTQKTASKITAHVSKKNNPTLPPAESSLTSVTPAYSLNPLRADLLLSQPTINMKLEKETIKQQIVYNTRGNNPKGNTSKENSSKDKAPKERSHLNVLGPGSLPLAEVGVTANDIVYLSASAKAGIQYLYGIGSLGFTSKGMRFRYGAGLRLPLNEYSALQAEFTTGALSRKSIDSFPQGGLLRERLNSYGLSWSKTIRPRLNLQLEVNYSTLKKSNDSTVLTKDKETNYYGYGTPLYNAKIGGNGNYYELNSWVGFRISLFYNLRRNNE